MVFIQLDIYLALTTGVEREWEVGVGGGGRWWEGLLNRQNLSSMTKAICRRSLIQIAFLWEVSYICTTWLPYVFSWLIKVLIFSEHNFFILKFHCLLLIFFASKYNLFRRVISVWYQCFWFPDLSISWQFPHKHSLLL